MKKKLFKLCLILLITLIPFYSFIVYLHVVAYRTGLPGFRGGPQDAFRHTLASAYVSRYVGPWAVEKFTALSESDLDSSYDQMDWHNNFIGKDIGQSDVENLYETVRWAVKHGQIYAQDKRVIRWLPEHKWADFLGKKYELQ